MKLEEILQLSENIVNDLSQKLNDNEIDHYKMEEMILKHINQIGSIMEQTVVNNIKEPTQENSITVDGEQAIFSQKRNLRYINRFGETTIINRRCYKYTKKSGGISPLDLKLGFKNCFRFSPMMTYLQCLYGGEFSYAQSANKLSKTLGFSISNTAVERNTEMVGAIIPENPIELIDSKSQNTESDLMIVEIDGTMSPQIKEIEGKTGIESLKAPTEYKEANIVVIEKYKNKKLDSRWTGAKYGPRKEFDDYVRKTGIKMGQLRAKKTVFIADGAPHNWEIQMNNFPDAVTILDFYHATEHLAQFCDLFSNKKIGRDKYNKWYSMLYEGDILQILAEMTKDKNDTIENKDEAVKQINYFDKNKYRMEYDLYRENGYPIGSGLVEGSCKLVIKKKIQRKWYALEETR